MSSRSDASLPRPPPTSPHACPPRAGSTTPSPRAHRQSSSSAPISSPGSSPPTTMPSPSRSSPDLSGTSPCVSSAAAPSVLISILRRPLQYLHTAAWGALAGLALLRFKPKIRFPATIVGVSATAGYGTGVVHYFREHKRFARQLEDREAFLVVLDNVNRRLGNTVPLFPQVDRDRIMHRINKKREENGEVLDGGIEIVSDFADSADSTALTGTPSSANGMSSARRLLEGAFTRPFVRSVSGTRRPSEKYLGCYSGSQRAEQRQALFVGRAATASRTPAYRRTCPTERVCRGRGPPCPSAGRV